MADDRILLYSIAGFMVGIVLFIKGFKWLKQKRMIENIPTSKIRSLAMGLVEIFGEVFPAEKKVLKSPFSNKDCVYYKYKVEEYRRSGKHSRWVTLKKDEDRVHFFLKDNTGKVLVDSTGANVEIPKDFQFRSSLGKDPPLAVKNFLKKQNMNFESLFGMNKTMRYTEYFIAPKDKLYILGTADDNPFVEEATAKESVEDIMIKKGKHEKFYYISDRHETEILKKFKWKVAGGIFGGGFLSVFCFIVILIYIRLLFL
ncbi:E3 ubiquitin ligase family protein [Candidatus Woesearchaeota archaeon]|nr:E3 ubiquitin ligase family protein [Candidatus Woesearchaeota archaeon]